jgi:hypothetical protein
MHRQRSTNGHTRTIFARSTALFGLLALLLAATAASAVAQGPSAIGQDSHGVSYVGFADSPKIVRVDGNGATLASWTAQAPVVAISVDPSDNVWVLTPSDVYEYTTTGALESTIDLHTCDSHGSARDANRYGGLVVTASNVYVGLNCSPTLERFDRSGGGFVSTTLPDAPRGLSFMPAQNGKPNQVFVALPDANRVLTFDADGFGSGVAPTHALTLATPGGGSTPMPTGIATDKYGQLMVADAANNFVTFYDTNGGDGSYRTLGHGPAGSSDLGSLNFPTALAVHAQDGSGYAGDLFVADYRNERIQRWNSYGYTYWAADTSTPGSTPVTAPTNDTTPSISGTATVGQTLTCNPGSWSGSPSYAYAWKRDGSTIGTSATYTVVSGDVGHDLTCTVTASNSAGSASATSGAVTASSAPATGCTGRAGVSINAAATYTNDPDVTLTVHQPSGATQVLLSNDGGFDDATALPIAGDCHYAFTLKTTGSERLPKTVYVRFVGPGFDNNLTLTDDIVLDQTAPTTSSATATPTSASKRAIVASVAKSRTRYVLKVKAKDKTSGVKKLQLSATRSGKHAKTVTYHSSIKLTSLSKAKWVRVYDRAGNPSHWRKVSVRKKAKHRR